MARLSKPQLLDKILDGIRGGGWTPIVLDDTHPFRIRASHPSLGRANLKVYVWNCTHGGGGRSAEEFRVQFTGAMPERGAAMTTLVLGWHDDHQVFAAWDIAAHDGQDSYSPSAQIRESSLLAANQNVFSVQPKDNEIVVAFRPEFIMDYVAASRSLHQTGAAQRDLALLNNLEDATDAQVDAIANPARQLVVRTIVTRYRAHFFSGRVLTAYGNQCAFCRVQLGLLDAAHILPVAAPDSTDEVTNGIALCKLHHYAYDSNLISFNAAYAIELSRFKLGELTAANLQGGLAAFRQGLLPSIHLPARAAQHPNVAYIRQSRTLRGWRQ